MTASEVIINLIDQDNLGDNLSFSAESKQNFSRIQIMQRYLRYSKNFE